MARDAHPDRLGAAAREIHTLLASLEGSSVGLVGFAGTARLLSPLSTDYDGIASIVETLGPEDIDLGMITGTGFPPFRGGLLRYADARGLDRIVERLEALAAERGVRYEPASNLRERAAAGRGFYE